MAKAAKAIKQEPLEKQLWKAADKLRKNIDAAEYKHVVLGLMFLKYISDAFEELHGRLQKGEGELAGADPEDKDEYQAENVFFVPAEARWPHLVARPSNPISARMSTPRWMPSNRKTSRSKACCRKSTRGKTSIPHHWVN
jgi:type I restriction enzyme M protein